MRKIIRRENKSEVKVKKPTAQTYGSSAKSKSVEQKNEKLMKKINTNVNQSKNRISASSSSATTTNGPADTTVPTVSDGSSQFLAQQEMKSLFISDADAAISAAAEEHSKNVEQKSSMCPLDKVLEFLRTVVHKDYKRARVLAKEVLEFEPDNDLMKEYIIVFNELLGKKTTSTETEGSDDSYTDIASSESDDAESTSSESTESSDSESDSDSNEDDSDESISANSCKSDK